MDEGVAVIDNNFLNFDVFSSSRWAWDNPHMVYLGEGTIHEKNGKPYNSKKDHTVNLTWHFWRYAIN